MCEFQTLVNATGCDTHGYGEFGGSCKCAIMAETGAVAFLCPSWWEEGRCGGEQPAADHIISSAYSSVPSPNVS